MVLVVSQVTWSTPGLGLHFVQVAVCGAAELRTAWMTAGGSWGSLGDNCSQLSVTPQETESVLGDGPEDHLLSALRSLAAGSRVGCW